MLRKIIQVSVILLLIGLFFFAQAVAAFHFAVIGDRTGDHVPGVFEQVLQEVERLHPDFVINVGDLIEGYIDEEKEINAEWDEIFGNLKTLSVPFHFVPGNHDIYNEVSAKIYEQRIGKPYYSFDYENYHFIILDNSRLEFNEPFPEAQLNWLKADLKGLKETKGIFVFFHKPFWYKALSGQGKDALHELFKAHKIKAVFSGHYHQYCHTYWDGVEYTMVGSSGGALENPDDLARGEFFQFVWVTVDSEKVDIVPIKLGNVFSKDQVSFEDLQAIEKVETQAFFFTPLRVKEKGINKGPFKLTLKNWERKPSRGKIRWNYKSPDWEIKPDVIDYEIPSESEMTYNFTATLKDLKKLYPLPILETEYPYRLEKRCRIKKMLEVHQEAICKRVKTPPQLDGKLDDLSWREGVPISLFGSPDGEATKTERVEIYFLHDATTLYVGARCRESKMDSLKANVVERDGPVWQEDYLWFFLDPDYDRKTYYQLIINPKGTVFDRLCKLEGGKSEKDITWNNSWPIKTGRGVNEWTLEMSIPLSEVGSPKEGKIVWGINMRRLQSRLGAWADWQAPVQHDPTKFGDLIFE